MHKVKNWLFDNSVLLVFICMGFFGFILSDLPTAFVLEELVSRVARNSFIVLALIIPIIAGMGLNFGIVMGAMAGQIAIVFVTDWGIAGFPGFLLAAAVSVPFAVLFGWLTGKLMNKTKGQEMITGMIAGYASNGVYQLLFLFVIGTLIPITNEALLVSNGNGVLNAIDLTDGLKYSLDNIYKTSLYNFVVGVCVIALLSGAVVIFRKWSKEKCVNKKHIVMIVGIIALLIVSHIPDFNMALKFSTVPVATMGVILLLCLFNTFILKTKFGQDLRTVGRNRYVANASGINVDQVRIKAIILSSILAAWGQLIFLQNIGTLNTYGSHEQVGLFASASILIGGATIVKATNTQAIMGVILFHLLFIVSPQAGQNLFNNAQIGEYFRQFIAYAVICISIALYAWQQHTSKVRE